MKLLLRNNGGAADELKVLLRNNDFGVGGAADGMKLLLRNKIVGTSPKGHLTPARKFCGVAGHDSPTAGFLAINRVLF
jgi:hypothetical protein